MLGIEQEVFRGSDKFPPDLAIATAERPRSRRPAAGKPTILIVDDQQMIADTLGDILNGSGFRAVVAYDGRSALEIAERMHPDYLLTDVVMPGMNGVELAIQIRKRAPGTKILLLSGQAGIADILQSGRQQGYEFDLVAKPIHPDRLIEHLRELRKK